jgi:hypothetical protein
MAAEKLFLNFQLSERILTASVTVNLYPPSLFGLCQPPLSQKMAYQASLLPGSCGVIPNRHKKLPYDLNHPVTVLVKTSMNAHVFKKNLKTWIVNHLLNWPNR